MNEYAPTQPTSTVKSGPGKQIETKKKRNCVREGKRETVLEDKLMRSDRLLMRGELM